MPALTGSNLIGPRESRAGAALFRAPDPSFPEELRSAQPRGIWRRVDRRLAKEAL